MMNERGQHMRRTVRTAVTNRRRGGRIPRRAGLLRAFTLLEVIVSIGLLVLLMSMMFWFYRSALEQRTQGLDVSREAQLARVVLDRMVQEIRQGMANVPGYGPGIFGRNDMIEINTVTVPDKELSEVRSIRDAQLPGQFDLQQVSYYIAWDYDNVDTNGDPRSLGLVRRVNRTYLRDVIVREDGEQQAETTDEAQLSFKEELYAPEIKYLAFHYFDGATWWDKWELAAPNSLPQMVRITIGFVPEIPESEEIDVVDDNFLKSEEEQEPLQEDRYSIVVRMPQADVFFGSRLTREASAFGESSGM